MQFFNDFGNIKYEGKETKNIFAFRHYNPQEIVMGETMKEQLRFSAAYWHTMTQDGSDPFGDAVNIRNWFGKSPMETALNRVDAFFELMKKLDIPFYTFHDADVAPRGDSLKEFFYNQDVVVEKLQQKMQNTGIKLLWNTANLFSDPIYVQGAATAPNADVFAYGAAQVKKGLDISKQLGGENYVFWGGREGYQTLINTNMQLEQDNLARMLHMAVDYTERIGHKVTFLLEPKPKEPMKHQYDFDAATTAAFLQKYNLDSHFKLNLEANHATLAGHTFEHELNVARTFNMLGSIDANQGDMLLGWDTDEFPTNLADTALALYQVLENGGIAPGGINFDAKVSRTSFEMNDLAIAHIVGMDTYARGLKAAAKMKEESFFEGLQKLRYISYETGIGKSIVDNKETLETLTDYALNNPNKITNKSDHSEYIKSIINDYIY